jgi:hypothetical protein
MEKLNTYFKMNVGMILLLNKINIESCDTFLYKTANNHLRKNSMYDTYICMVLILENIKILTFIVPCMMFSHGD